MRASYSILAVAALAAGLCAAKPAAAAEPLRMGGTGSSLGMLRQVGADFTAATGIKVDVVPSLGSSGAIHALRDGNLDLVVSARPLKPKETAAGLRQVLVLQTPFVLATSRRDPGGLKVADLVGLFAGKEAVWPDGAPMRLILRPRSETDTDLLGSLYPGMQQAIEAARRRSEIPVAPTDQDNIALAERTPGSLTGTTLAQLTTEHSSLHVIALDGVTPTLANFESRAYRPSKQLHFIVAPTDRAAVQRFLAFLQSPPGVKALRAAAVLSGAP